MITEIAVSCEKPLGHTNKKELWEETIKVWDYLVDSGYRPADFSQGEVTMRHQSFKKLLKENGNRALTKETRHYKINVVFIGNVEISFTEVKPDVNQGWLIEDNWSALGVEY